MEGHDPDYFIKLYRKRLVMNLKILYKAKQIPSDIKGVFSGPPDKYWKWFVLLIMIIFVLTLAGDIYIFKKMNASAFSDITPINSPQFITTDKNALVNIYNTINLKEKKFDEILNAPEVRDPSL